jgi:IS30 family transposase
MTKTAKIVLGVLGGFVLLVIVVGATGCYLVMSAFQSQETSQQEADAAFTEMRAKFPGVAPALTFGPEGPGVARTPPATATAKPPATEHLRRTRPMRRSRHYTQKTEIHGRIIDAISISERPASAEDRAVPGHWEGDLLIGGHNSQIATLVERQTRYVMLVKVPTKDSQTVVNALVKNARKLPQELYKSLTWDRGTEMHGHKQFTLATNIKVYFCDPQSPWQRGTNENTNGLLRQYLPKGIDVSTYSQAKLNSVARQLNERPRKTLGYRTPAELFSLSVASTS